MADPAGARRVVDPSGKAGYELAFEDTFDGEVLDEARWLPYYLPQWSSREASAARYELGGGVLRLVIEADQQPWCPEFDGQTRVSSLQTGVFAGPVGSTVGQSRFDPGLVVRQAQRNARLYTPQYGLFELRAKAIDDPRCMVALWMIGYEDQPERSAEICICEIFGRNVGADRAGVGALGIRVGHTVTSPKEYVRLLGTRATGRSFDDRVGSTALVLAAGRLEPARLRHTVIFIWSTREEIGLEGARAAAAALGLRPARVHAVDTFVSADSPLERTNFGLAPLGAGAVARALDNSSVTPPALLDSLLRLARGARVPLQVGATNGGNDGSAFAEWGVPDVPLGWPLRYSHSPAEVADLRDVAVLAELVRVVAERW